MNSGDKKWLLSCTTIGGLAIFIALAFRDHWVAAILLLAVWAVLTWAIIKDWPRGNWPHNS